MLFTTTISIIYGVYLKIKQVHVEGQKSIKEGFKEVLGHIVGHMCMLEVI